MASMRIGTRSFASGCATSRSSSSTRSRDTWRSCYDGLLDGLEGYLLVKPGSSPPAMRSTVFGEALIRLEPLGDGWYRFATT